MTNLPTLGDNDERALAEIVDALTVAEESLAALEAERVVQLAAATRIVMARQAHRPASVQVREMQLRSIAAEIAVALRWSDRTVQRRMSDALSLVEDFPATVDALACGRISARHAAVIREAGVVIDDPDERAAFEQVVLERATTDTAARTQAFARAVAEELHPQSIAERSEHAEHNRRVWMDDLGDGAGQLGIADSITKVRAMYDRLTQQARAVRRVAVNTETGPGADTGADGDGDEADAVRDSRTLDQTRADLACDLILTGQPAIDPTQDVLPGGLGAIRAHVQVTVPALTAAGVHDRGASIDGVSPIDAETARRLMATAPGWDRILTHPVTGTVLAVDRYRATAAMERFLTARDRHCRFPGCRQPARLCDHDHNTDWARGGPTDVCNQACLCKRHHTLKTETEWSATQLPDGSIRWTTPLRRTVIDRPEPYVAFVPDGDPPPF